MAEIVPWTWALVEDETRFAELPPAEPAGSLPAGRAYAALSLAANDQAAMVVMIGWDRTAYALLAADPVLMAKTVVWLMPPGQMRHLAEAITACGRPAELLVTAYDGPDHLPLLLDRLPLLCWGLVSLDPDAGLLDRVQHLRRQRLYAAYQVAERTLTDLGHLLARESRLADAIPLSTWAGAWRGRTALCIAAGPSLDRHLPMVRANMDRCLVVCADIIHHRVAAAGIKIDFVVNVDSHQLIADRMAGSDDPHSVLVMPLGGHRDLDRRFPRCSYAGGDALADRLLGPGNAFGHGTNVGGATVGFAAFAGCTELVLVGHDLSFAKDCFYSSLVASRDQLEKRSLDIGAAQMTEVEGNDGTTVLTYGNFKVGIRDLGMMAGHLRQFGVVVRNPNIGHGIGARIPFAEPLPPDWRPLQADLACPRPVAGAHRHPASPGVAQLVRSGVTAVSASWTDDGRTLVQRMSVAQTEPAAILGQQIVLPFVLGLVAHAFRLQAMPAGVQRQANQAATERLAGPLMAVATAAIDRVLARGDWAIPDRIQPWTPRQRAFFVELRAHTPQIAAGTIDDVLIPLIARDWRSLLDVVPEAPLPPPHSFFDGLHVCASLGERTPAWYVHETIAHCMLAEHVGLGFVLDLARAAEVVTAVEIDPATLGDGPHPAIAAARATARLARGTSTDLHADAVLAAAWAPAQLAAVRALLACAGGGPVCDALMAEGRLLVDDVLAEVILRGHPDTLKAIESLEPHQAVLGEGATLAIAERHLAIGEHAMALAHLDRIRPLSSRAAETLTLIFDCLAAAQGMDEVERRFSAFPDRDTAVRGFHGFLVRRLGRSGAVQALPGCNLDPLPAALLTSILAGLMTSGEIDAAAAASIIELADRARAAADGAEAAALDEVRSLAERAKAVIA